MPFSQGQKFFALMFLCSFIVMLIIAYRSDAKIYRMYYKNVWIVLLSVIAILATLMFLIKKFH